MLSQFSNSENKHRRRNYFRMSVHISVTVYNRWKTIGTDRHPIVQQSAEAISPTVAIVLTLHQMIRGLSSHPVRFSSGRHMVLTEDEENAVSIAWGFRLDLCYALCLKFMHTRMFT